MTKPRRGHPLQVVSIFNNSIVIHEQQLKSILDESHDAPVAVVSITGQGRQGKSFLANFIQQYSDSSWDTQDDQDWMKDIDMVHGFRFSSGYEAVTKGLVMWSQPMFVTIQEETVALLLIDCQGLFDSETTVEENKILCNLCCVLSSLLLLNVRSPFNESHLEYFSEIFDFGRIMFEKGRRSLQRLLIVLRDTTLGDTEDGVAEGHAWLKGFLEQEGMSRENQANRKSLTGAFESVNAFVFPPPPDVVNKSDFSGSLKDMKNSEEGKEFMASIDSFVKHLKTLTTSKVFDGSVLTGKGFLKTLKLLTRLLNSSVHLTASQLKTQVDAMRLQERLSHCIIILQEEVQETLVKLIVMSTDVTSTELAIKVEELFTSIRTNLSATFMEDDVVREIKEIEFDSFRGTPVYVFSQVIDKVIKSAKVKTEWLTKILRKGEETQKQYDDQVKDLEAQLEEIKANAQTQLKAIEAKYEERRLAMKLELDSIHNDFKLKAEKMKSAVEEDERRIQVELRRLENENHRLVDLCNERARVIQQLQGIMNLR